MHSNPGYTGKSPMVGMGMGTMIMIAFCKTGEVFPALGLIPPGFRASSQLCNDCTVCIVYWHVCCLSHNTNHYIITSTLQNLTLCAK